MKRISIILVATIGFTLSSCSNPGDNARIGALTSLAVSYAEATGKISPAEAAAIRAAQMIILAPASAAAAAPPIGKAPRVGLQP